MDHSSDTQTTSKKILIIDDAKPMAKAIEIKLQKNGYQAKAVFNGEQGIKELESSHYDLVLLDIMMPVVDGWNVLEQIKAKGIKTKVIITSNLSQEEDIKRAKEMGAFDFLVKSDTTLTGIADKVQTYL